MDAETGLWNSASCLRELPYICQKQERIVGNKLTDSTFESLMTCHDWIHQALTCRKPAGKIPKYEFRFTKVAKGKSFEYLNVKCNNELFRCSVARFGGEELQLESGI